MEKVNNQIKSNLSRTGIYERLVFGLLKKFKFGELVLEKEDGNTLVLGNGNSIKAYLKINHQEFYKKCVLFGDIGLGEAYCDGDWDSPDLTKVIRWFIQNIEVSGVLSGSKSKNLIINLLKKFNQLRHIFNKNSKKKSIKNVAYHYDISNDFYKLMLDETMSYSCGIFLNKKDTLKDAQLNKFKTLGSDLDIQPGDHILEIGCGWGGFAKYAIENYDCKVTGLTLSKKQYKYVADLIKSQKLKNRFEVLLKDYRDIQGVYDKVISIEMIEQVGDEFILEYFKKINTLLKKEGVAVIQAITSPDSRYQEFKNGVDFIQKHIFPGTLLPSITRMISACQKTGSLQLINLRDIGPHYSKTLRLWNLAITLKKHIIKKLGIDESFFRKWKYYLNYCEAAFRERNISNVQITLVKPNSTSYRFKDWHLIDT